MFIFKRDIQIGCFQWNGLTIFILPQVICSYTQGYGLVHCWQLIFDGNVRPAVNLTINDGQHLLDKNLAQHHVMLTLHRYGQQMMLLHSVRALYFYYVSKFEVGDQ